MSEGMSVERIAELGASSPTRDEMHEALAEVERLRDRVAHLDSTRDSAVREWKREHDAADVLQRENAGLRARLDEIGETREEWGYGDAPERVSVPLAQGYRNGTPRQWAEEAARRSSLKVWMRVAGEWREVPDA